ncbi:Glycosyl transferase family 2 [Butyrivibrio fibrisolvens DSM 3071]|uniref:Glycosyl transferase family 2 n=1 Tax=Butyrivibrio fibrisolvens DSM 3071 TaxID=1121131 RepID=A0A1M5YMM3_BUTFI|nr:glycosyltransferase family 2 protein [Butyrivibrio fibrisolvens]SHI13347.1 Glycosyl transferase family 2 [Butyrivibrio fibrisolvens DSM 3071]
MNLVTVIVPAYNSGRTIERCIKSLLEQTYKEKEIIIVDDGSSDNTPVICKRYEGIPGFKYFKSVHGGVSKVRNLGLEKATGKYVMFVDADDYAKDTFLEKMVDALEGGDCDMCICNYLRVVYNDCYPIKSLQKRGIVTRNKYLIDTLRDPGHHYFGVIWNKIFKTEIIRNNSIRFRNDITLGEDFVFTLDYLRYASKVNVIDDKLIYYCYQSVNTLSRVQEKKISDCEKEMANRNLIYETYVDVMKRVGLFEKYKKKINRYWIVFYLRQKYDLMAKYKWSLEDKKLWMKEILSNDNVKNSLRLFKKSEITMQYAYYIVTQTTKNVIKAVIKTAKGVV